MGRGRHGLGVEAVYRDGLVSHCRIGKHHLGFFSLALSLARIGIWGVIDDTLCASNAVLHT